MAIFADKRIASKEIDAFVQAIKTLQSHNILKSELSEARILIWYETNKDKLTQIITAHKFEEWINKVGPVLRRQRDATPIFKAIQYISKADDEYHVSENAYANILQKQWMLPAV